MDTPELEAAKEIAKELGYPEDHQGVDRLAAALEGEDEIEDEEAERWSGMD